MISISTSPPSGTPHWLRGVVVATSARASPSRSSHTRRPLAPPGCAQSLKAASRARCLRRIALCLCFARGARVLACFYDKAFDAQ